MSSQYSLPEMRKWLEGDSKEAVEWRTDPKNLRYVSEMVQQYQETPGGKVGSQVMAKIQREINKRRLKEKQEQEHQATQARLKEVALRDWIANGGTEREFSSEWFKLKKELLSTGRAQALLDEEQRERRAKTARTF